jgi:serine/threonine protein kinase
VADSLRERYRLESKISSKGSFGEIWLATDTLLDRPVAIKCPKATDDPIRRERFLIEARMLARLNHPNITQIYDAFFDEGENSLYLVIEFVDGRDLSQVISTGNPLPLEIVLEIATGVLRALSYAHEQGVVHRDIKPANVMIADDVKLTDFGLASLQSILQRGTGFRAGTPAYMAPEQIEGRAIDDRADLYALGVILFEMLTGGRLPFEYTDEEEMMDAHLHANPPPVRQLAPTVPPGLEEAITRLLAKNLEDRYPSAEAVMDVLDTVHVGPRLVSHPDQLTPFVAGPPIIAPRQFFGRERELKRIFGLWQRFPLQHVALVGPKRSGKTSLLHYLKNITQAEPAELRPGQRGDWLPHPERFQWVFIDFQDVRMTRRERLLRHILSSLDMPVPSPCDLDTFMDVFSQHLQRPTVILMDEIGAGLASPELDQSFWYSLRSLVSHHTAGHLAFVLTSHSSPAQLAQDRGKPSPFFNIFQSLELGPLTGAEARELIASSPQSFPPADVDWILEQSRRWPCLLQILCQARLHALEEGETDDGWREQGLRQIDSFRYLLT